MRRTILAHPAIGILLGCLAVVALAAILASGCSEDTSDLVDADPGATPLAPSTDFSFDPDQVVDLDPSDPGAEPGPGIGTEGGEVVKHWLVSGQFVPGQAGLLQIGPDMVLELGGGSLTAPAVITVECWRMEMRKTVQWILFDFNPAMVFAQPVLLKVKESMATPLAGADGLYRLWHLNETTQAWELADIGEVANKNVQFELDHFSKYAVAR